MAVCFLAFQAEAWWVLELLPACRATRRVSSRPDLSLPVCPEDTSNSICWMLKQAYRSSVGLPSGSVEKNPPAMQETQARSRGQEDPLEREVAPHSSILAWRIPWTEEPGGLQSIAS